MWYREHCLIVVVICGVICVSTISGQTSEHPGFAHKARI